MDYIKAQTLTPSLFSLFHETRILLILVFWWDFYFDLGFPSISRTEASKRLKIELENWFCKKDIEFISNVTVTWWLSTEFNFHVELNFGYSEKATKFEKISHIKFDITQYIVSYFKWKIFSNFVAFSKYPNFNLINLSMVLRWCT